MNIFPPICNQQFHPLGAPNARHGHIQLAMCKYRLGQKNVDHLQCLPLRLIDGHAKCRAHRELRRHKVKGIRSVSEGVMLSRGMNNRWPFAGPVATSASMTCYMSWMTMSLVPLARPLVMLRNNMMGQPSCKCSSWGGTPEKLSVFKNSMG